MIRSWYGIDHKQFKWYAEWEIKHLGLVESSLQNIDIPISYNFTDDTAILRHFSENFYGPIIVIIDGSLIG